MGGGGGSAMEISSWRHAKGVMGWRPGKGRLGGRQRLDCKKIKNKIKVIKKRQQSNMTK